VLELYVATLSEIGNPASVHSFGQRSRQILEQAREEIAQAVKADRNEVIFTSGGTESDNLAIKGLYWNVNSKNPEKNVIVSAAAEHHAVLDAINWLVDSQNAELYLIPSDNQGVLDLGALEDFLAKNASRVALISVMWANNEIGVIHPISKITEIANQYQIPVHSDAIAALGHTPVDFAASGLAAMTITGHKLGGPVGSGALILRRDQKLTPVNHGGGQERNLRSGTPDAASAAALALTVTEAVAEQGELAAKHKAMTDLLIAEVKKIATDVIVSAELAPRLPNNAHFRFPGCLGDSLLFLLDSQGVSISTGSACTAGVSGPSHVVLSLGASNDEAMGTLRITLGHSTKDKDIEAFLQAFPKAYEGAKKAGLTRR
jgi:cysteine desulfurase